MTTLDLTLDGYTLTDTERHELSTSVRGMVDHYRHQPEQLKLMMLEAVSVVQTVSIRSTAALEQNWFWRQWHRFTGKTVKRNTEDLHDLARGLHLTQEFLACLQQQQLFTAEALVVMDSKVSQLLRDMSGLQGGQIRQQQHINELYKGLLTFIKQAEERFDNHEQRIGHLEWADLLKSPKPIWQGRSYKELDTREKLLCLANDFFRVTKGQPALDDWYRLHTRLEDVGLNPNAEMPIRLIYEELDDELFYRWLKDVVDPEKLDELATPATPVAYGFVLLKRYQGKDRHQIEVMQDQLRDNGVEKPLSDLQVQTMARHVRQHCGRNFDNSTPLYDCLSCLVSDLLHINLSQLISSSNQNNLGKTKKPKSNKPKINSPERPKTIEVTNNDVFRKSDLSVISSIVEKRSQMYSALIVERADAYRSSMLDLLFYIDGKHEMTIENGRNGNIFVTPGIRHIKIVAKKLLILPITELDENIEFKADETKVLKIDAGFFSGFSFAWITRSGLPVK